MNKTIKKARQIRVRERIKEVLNKPRLSVFRSNQYMSAQVIDDRIGKTVVGLSEKTKVAKEKGKKTDRAKELGVLIAKAAIAKKITEVVFDRGSYRYHGRVKAFAEGAREGGLKF